MGLGTTITVVVGIAGLGIGAMQVPEIHDRVFAPNKGEEKRVVMFLNGAIQDAMIGRTNMAELNRQANNCERFPSTIADSVRPLVTANRDNGLKDLAKIGPAPTDSNAQALLEAFRLVMSKSKTADETYVDWLDSWSKQYRSIKLAGCAKSAIPRRGVKWTAFDGADKIAARAKRDFLRLYNGPARKYGFTPPGWKDF